MINFFNKKINGYHKPKQTAKCPKCNGIILDNGEYWSCENTLSKSCDFNIRNIFEGEKIDIGFLINLQKTEGLKDICDKIENEYKEEYSLRRYFKSNNVKKVEGLCRNCFNPLYRVDGFIKCKGDNCNFSINSTYKGVTFSDYQMNDLFDRRVSDEYEFTEPDGTKIKGRVIVLQNEKYKVLPEYLFFTDFNELDEKYLNLYYLPSKQNFRRRPIKTLIKQKNKS